ncbi:ABC transporter transmembrane region 2-domain-containing protein [Jimgerdemannia flammicorona]|uniref:ABC transporter transmembrane region 2-domain-containing protein n=1 Tax=Jimgerdemannia flammicorona TaxID=994334 RepID=A0A433DF07_9FUNG|nr:ABC transporter transmembrane region 2-domain-containing protein [Jimgerdemannia flammicorona]
MRLGYRSVPDDTPHAQNFEVPTIKDDDDRRARHVPLDITTPTAPPPKQRYSFDKLFLQRLKRILRLLFTPSTQGLFSRESRERSLLWMYLVFVGVSCLNEVVVYFVGMVTGKFYKVLVDKNAQAFGALILPTILLIAAAALGKSLVKFMGGLFSLKIRRLLTDYIQDQYIQRNIFYRLLAMHESIDNPDQRITQDVDKFAETVRKICEELIISPLLIIYYTYKCWSVGGFIGPFLIYTYFALGSVSSRALINPIVNIVFMKEFHEGNFRYLHVRLRQFAESIAFSRGEKEENVRIGLSLSALLSYQRQIVNKELALQLVTEAFSYFGSILSYLIIAIPIFTGRYDGMSSGELSELISKVCDGESYFCSHALNDSLPRYMRQSFIAHPTISTNPPPPGLFEQNAFLSLYLIYRFTVIIEQSTKISDLAGYTARIGQLIETLTDIHTELENIDIDNPYREEEDQAIANIFIKFENISFSSPTGKPIMSNLDLLIEKDTNWMLVGPNGRVVLPTLKTGREIIFLPQTPYLLFGSLRAQITYPSIDSTNNSRQRHLGISFLIVTISDEDIELLLQQVGLSHLATMVESFDTPYGQDWYKMLSPGEQQKLSFARIFYWKPLFAILDEATSHMDSTTESSLFSQARNLGISLITVSHNTNLLLYHDRVLVLDWKGGYTTMNVEEDGMDVVREAIRQSSGGKVRRDVGVVEM